MGESVTVPLAMKTTILAACVLALSSGQTFQSFPAGGAQPVAQRPQFVFNPRQQVLAQQQQRQARQQQAGVPQFNPQAVPQQFRQPAVAQAAPQQFRQPANTQALRQQFIQRQAATQQFRQPQVAPQQLRQPQAAPQQFRQPQAPPQQFRQPVIPQPQPQQLQQAIPQSAPQQFRKPQVPQPSQPQFSPQIQAGSAPNDALGNLQIDSEQYVHDPSGDATLSRFQQFQLKKKQEAGR